MVSKKTRKAVFIVGDGLGDIPCAEFNGLTPLESANTPMLDFLAEKGICGLMHPIERKVPGSDTAHLALFGYDPLDCYRGRGALEAIGAGISLKEHDVAFRLNFATVDKDFVVLNRRAGRQVDEGAEFMAALRKIRLTSAPEVKIIFKHTVEHRGVLVLSGPNLSSKVGDTDPHEPQRPILEAKPLTNEPSAIRTANILNELTYRVHRILDSHPLNKARIEKGLLPANILLFRGAGQRPLIKPLHDLYSVKPAFVAAVALIRGVCKAVGMKEISCKGATGTYETDVVAKGLAASNALKKHNLVFVHFKATDNASHDQNPQMKRKMCEKLDLLVKTIWDKVDHTSTVIVVTGDHSTPVDCGDHTAEPLPILLCSPIVRKDEVKAFGERSCSHGGLGHIKGREIIPIIVNQLRLEKKFGS
ncbi:MAG: 2,3-bisphosphoglycerate-independent phosphoglycerate mutase [Candidatus Ranarchaeia archaeon]